MWQHGDGCRRGARRATRCGRIPTCIPTSEDIDDPAALVARLTAARCRRTDDDVRPGASRICSTTTGTTGRARATTARPRSRRLTRRRTAPVDSRRRRRGVSAHPCRHDPATRPAPGRSSGAPRPSAQFGIDHPRRACSPPVTLADERMLGALAIGVPRSGVSVIGLESGATESDVRRLLRALEPVPANGTPHDRRSRPTAHAWRWPARDPPHGEWPTPSRSAGSTVAPRGRRGRRPTQTPSRTSRCVVGALRGRPRLARLLAARRRAAPRRRVRRRRGAHRSDGRAGHRARACYCLERQRADADAAWPAIASQLLGTRSLTETPLISAEVAALAARIVVVPARAWSVVRVGVVAPRCCQRNAVGAPRAAASAVPVHRTGPSPA